MNHPSIRSNFWTTNYTSSWNSWNLKTSNYLSNFLDTPVELPLLYSAEILLPFNFKLLAFSFESMIIFYGFLRYVVQLGLLIFAIHGTKSKNLFEIYTNSRFINLSSFFFVKFFICFLLCFFYLRALEFFLDSQLNSSSVLDDVCISLLLIFFLGSAILLNLHNIELLFIKEYNVF